MTHLVYQVLLLSVDINRDPILSFQRRINYFVSSYTVL